MFHLLQNSTSLPPMHSMILHQTQVLGLICYTCFLTPHQHWCLNWNQSSWFWMDHHNSMLEDIALILTMHRALRLNRTLANVIGTFKRGHSKDAIRADKATFTDKSILQWDDVKTIFCSSRTFRKARARAVGGRHRINCWTECHSKVLAWSAKGFSIQVEQPDLR